MKTVKTKGRAIFTWVDMPASKFLLVEFTNIVELIAKFSINI